MLYQTKEWRISQSWWKGGRRTECEKYQVECIEEIMGIKLYKTNERIKTNENVIVCCYNPYKYNDGYEYTENFDRKFVNNKYEMFFNLKMVCGSGGEQTRTLKDVYQFVKSQLEYSRQDELSMKYFVNILDGDFTYKNKDKFKFLVDKVEYVGVRDKIFVGDMNEFKVWFSRGVKDTR